MHGAADPATVRAVSLDDDVRDELRKLEAAHRLRVPRVVDGVHGPRITLDGVSVINAASNDYLSLAGDRALPPCFVQRYGSIEVGNRGGIVTAETTLKAPLD